ncbi:MAG: hypothetical protein EOQ86_11980 [Mesorhizobium sp.]|nr:MAG: hypothetical protein EOQ85_29250 [Mesorhizobium sp.]RWH83155.1 MAG: hypothetical protein EOQ86_11980 [Mesorhizobium sp.]RWH91767.1 MAG: hypothetical protein EOQ87_06095 [Mesorhizobium sp.]RWI00420.1 MAG: hypothetical protein EOQ88_06070 [Mesorhizobium sp.]RWI06299.1 MAG: hypothetical protein EOQ89_00625 [Mesorhizobium sp.]
MRAGLALRLEVLEGEDRGFGFEQPVVHRFCSSWRLEISYSAARVFQTRKGRCGTLILRMILSENRFRFSGSCARRLVEGPVPLPDFDAFEQPGLGVGVCCR